MTIRWPPVNPFRQPVALVPVALLAFIVSACNHEPQITEVEYPYAEPGKIYFFSQPKDSPDNDDAEITGKLVLIDGCLRIEVPYLPPEWYSSVVWPKGYELVVEDEQISILNVDGERVVRVGDEVFVGGSGDGSDGGDRIGECRGPFWHANTNDTVKTLATATPE